MSDWDVDTLSLKRLGDSPRDCRRRSRPSSASRSSEYPGAARVAVAYAVRNPERVSHLILYGAFALGGKKRAPAEKEMREAMTTLIRLGWGADNPSFRQMFTARFIPGGTHEQAEYFTELQLKTTSPEPLLDISTSSAISVSLIFCRK